MFAKLLHPGDRRAQQKVPAALDDVYPTVIKPNSGITGHPEQRDPPRLLSRLRRWFVVSAGSARAIVRSRRARGALLTNSISSLGNFTLTVGIARGATTQELGLYALAFAAYVLLSGASRAAVTESLLGIPSPRLHIAAHAGRISAVGAVAAFLLLAIALPASSLYLAILAISIHGLLILDYAKTVGMALDNVASAVRADVAWTFITALAFGCTIVGWLNAAGLFAAWAVSGGVIGYIFAVRARIPVRPAWFRGAKDRRVAALYSADYLAGSGAVQFTLIGLAAAAGAAVAGAIRGAGILLSPVNVLASSARPLLIPYLVQRRTKVRDELRAAVTGAALVTAAALPLAALAVFLPDRVGEALLGETWPLASSLALPLAFDALLAIVAGVAFAGHRAHRAARRTLAVRLSLAPVRVLAVTLSGLTYGASGAAWAMAGVSLIGVGLWWTSFVSLSRGEAR